ncbi:hypothetical protein [Streptomyces sp. NL15-2K]|uniref:hypothetical protein n=1 Tax=Streptomyces sp. NL15-2K TaxID=376149 RepID=UPI000F559FC1|nr:MULTISPECIES: hypothetical protein [Actinomycetes]WKX13385.1 hypothetical protein Q4V64_40030 [Kutzneria buriramensis]GCB45242.1 hypothetical protein SNL152K_2532 [Streptomyces sp. NL15-2K]
MFRGTTVRTVVAILAAALLALPFFAPTEQFASAHTARQVEAKAQPGIKLSAKALRDETATFRHCDPAEDPTGPLRPRDRHRAIDFAPEAPERPVPTQDRADTDRRLTGVALTTSRPSTAHSPAALQVFRC